MAVFQRLIDEAPQYPWRYHELGLTLLKRAELLESRGLKAEAAADFAASAAAQIQWLDHGRTDAGVHSVYAGHVCYGLPGSEIMRWEAVARHAVKLWPDDANCWTGLGRAQYRLGHFPEAKETLLKAVDRQPAGNGVLWFYLAMTHWMLDENDPAGAAFERGLEWVRQNQTWLSEHKSEADAMLSLQTEVAKLLSKAMD